MIRITIRFQDSVYDHSFRQTPLFMNYVITICGNQSIQRYKLVALHTQNLGHLFMLLNQCWASVADVKFTTHVMNEFNTTTTGLGTLISSVLSATTH